MAREKCEREREGERERERRRQLIARKPFDNLIELGGERERERERERGRL